MTRDSGARRSPDTSKRFLSEGNTVFTAIISDVGEVLEVTEQAEGLRRLNVNGLQLRSCHHRHRRLDRLLRSLPDRVVERGGSGSRDFFAVDVAAETLPGDHRGFLESTAPGSTSNARCASGDELGRHIVSGRVDGIAELLTREDLPDMAKLVLQVPADLARFIGPERLGRTATASRSRSTRSSAILSRC